MLVENSLVGPQYSRGGLYDFPLSLITVESSFSLEIETTLSHVGGYL